MNNGTGGDKREPKFSLRFHVLVSTPLLETGFLKRKFPVRDWKKKRTPTGGPLEKAGADSQSQLGDGNGAEESQGQVWLRDQKRGEF